MSSLSPAGRSAAAHQNVRGSLRRFTLSEGRECRSPATTHLESTLTNSLIGVDSKAFTETLSPLIATLRKKQGGLEGRGQSSISSH